VVKEVVLATVVGRGAPLISITELVTKEDPVTVRITADVPPATAATGERVVMAGMGFTTDSGSVFEFPPFGGAGGGAGGLRMLILRVPPLATSAVPRSTKIEVEPATAVVHPAVPMQVMPLTIASEVETKFSPCTVISGEELPATSVCGFSESMWGMGVAFGVMVNVTCPDVPPPGAVVKTTTVDVPGFCTSAAGTVACNCVWLRKIVIRVVPFHWTVEPGEKFVPLANRKNCGLPARMLGGFSDTSTGTG